METIPWMQIGAHVLVHGVNDDYVGEIFQFLPGRVVALKNASWVSESGFLFDFVKNGKADNMEIEPVGDHMVHWEGITHWPHPLFTAPHPPR